MLEAAKERANQFVIQKLLKRMGRKGMVQCDVCTVGFPKPHLQNRRGKQMRATYTRSMLTKTTSEFRWIILTWNCNSSWRNMQEMPFTHVPGDKT